MYGFTVWLCVVGSYWLLYLPRRLPFLVLVFSAGSWKLTLPPLNVSCINKSAMVDGNAFSGAAVAAFAAAKFCGPLLELLLRARADLGLVPGLMRPRLGSPAPPTPSTPHTRFGSIFSSGTVRFVCTVCDKLPGCCRPRFRVRADFGRRDDRPPPPTPSLPPRG